jgi:hypothetical protein
MPGMAISSLPLRSVKSGSGAIGVIIIGFARILQVGEWTHLTGSRRLVISRFDADA